MKMRGWLYQALFFVLATLVSCGSKDRDDDSDGSEESRSSIIVTSGISGDARTTLIGATFVQSGSYVRSSPFALTASADTWTIQMTDCLSGYTATVTNLNLDGLEAYKGDRNCLAKLTQFTYNGRTYYPTVADAFTTWQVGDVAKFDELGEPGIAPVHVAVMSTLGSPILPSDTISYAFREVLSGGTFNILWSTYGAHGRYISGVPAASSFSVRKTEFLGFALPSEAGQFRFLLECASTIGITNICESFNFTTADYKLVEDTYLNAPTDAELATLFGAPGTPITLPGERVAPGDQGTTNGGFITVTLDGPAALASKPNMLLLIRDGSNYQYLNIDVVVAIPWQQSPYPTIALFPFDTGPGVTADTSLYNPASLTDNSTAAAPTPKFGQARAFSTASTTMTAPSATKYNLMADKWTVEGWINLAAQPANNTYWPVVSRDGLASGTRSWAIKLRRQSNQTRFTVERSLNGNTVNAATTVSIAPAIGTWYHFAIVFNNGSTGIYFNGALVDTLSFTPGPVFAAGPLQFGGALGGNAFNGRLDDIRFSNTLRYSGATLALPTTAFAPEW